ncbi:MAG: SUMF1/EgtB/PvdO family nonheme iron enzyme [bacterium]
MLGRQSDTVTVRAVKENFRVIDLAGGPDAERYPVTRHLTIEDPQREIFKTTSLLLRRIDAAGAAFTMGAPADEIEGRVEDESDETPHEVSFTNDYFVGVFEITRQQWEQVTGVTVGEDPGVTRPAEQISYDDIRGANNGGNWPASRAVDPDSFLGLLRERSNLPFLDLPTEAQWEFACRAGTTSALNSGEDLSAAQSAPELDPLGRYWYNGGEKQKHAPVGTYDPNAWGLYDMHGNVAEWCLDWYADYSQTPVINPAGPSTGSQRVLRGGSWLDPAKNCRSAARDSAPDTNRGDDSGFRIAMLAPEKPRIISFIPIQATPGTEITINGAEFIGTQSVEFNGVSSPRFSVDSDTRLRATVPDSATSGPITVTTLAGTAESPTDFVVKQHVDAPAFSQAATGWSADSASVSTTTEMTAVEGDLYLAAVSATIAVSRYTNVRADDPLDAIASANTNGVDGECSDVGEDTDQYSFNIGVQSEASRVFVALGKRRRDLVPGTDYTLRGEITADTGKSGDDSSVAVLDRLAAPFTDVPVNGKLSWPSDWAAIAVEIPPNQE